MGVSPELMIRGEACGKHFNFVVVEDDDDDDDDDLVHASCRGVEDTRI